MAFDVGGLFGATPPNTALSRLDPETEARARALYAQLAQYQQQYNAANANQNALGSYFDQVIRGTTPSVANAQLMSGLGAIQQGAASQAAGVAGPGNALANYGAIQTGGAAGVQTNQQAAQLRAEEIANALRAKQQLLAQQAGQAGNMYQTGISGSNQLQGFATQGATAESQEQQEREQANRAFFTNLAGGAGNILGRYALSRPGQ